MVTVDPHRRTRPVVQRGCHADDFGQRTHPCGDVPRGSVRGGPRQRLSTAFALGCDQHLLDGLLLQAAGGRDRLGASGLTHPEITGCGRVSPQGSTRAQAQHDEDEPADDRPPRVVGAPTSHVHWKISHTPDAARPPRAAGSISRLNFPSTNWWTPPRAMTPPYPPSRADVALDRTAAGGHVVGDTLGASPPRSSPRSGRDRTPLIHGLRCRRPVPGGCRRLPGCTSGASFEEQPGSAGTPLGVPATRAGTPSGGGQGVAGSHPVVPTVRPAGSPATTDPLNGSAS